MGWRRVYIFFQGIPMEDVDIKLNKLRRNIEKSVVRIDNKELRALQPPK